MKYEINSIGCHQKFGVAKAISEFSHNNGVYCPHGVVAGNSKVHTNFFIGPFGGSSA